MWIIIIGLIIAFFVSKDVRKNVLGLVYPSLNVIKTLPGFLFLGYYIYIAIFFEEKITFIVLILSIYLFVQDFFKTNDRLDKIGYTDMIHIADLIMKRGDYSNFPIDKRKSIFNSIYQFSRRIPVKYKTIIIDKKYTDNGRILR